MLLCEDNTTPILFFLEHDTPTILLSQLLCRTIISEEHIVVLVPPHSVDALQLVNLVLFVCEAHVLH